MIAIVLSACLINDASICRDHRIPLVTEVTHLQCMTSAQPQIAIWSEEHPQWRIVRWECRPAREKDI